MHSQTIERLILEHIRTWQHYQLLARDNQAFTPPNDSIWGRVTVVGGVNQIKSVSTPCILETGTLIVQLFVKQHQGTADIKGMADSLAEHLALQQLGRLELLAPSITNVPAIDSLYQLNVSVPYRYY